MNYDRNKNSEISNKHENLSIFPNHHTIIGGCTAPVSNPGQIVAEFAGVLLYHYVVLYQDPSGNENSHALSLIYYRLRNREEKDFRTNSITSIFHKEYSSN